MPRQPSPQVRRILIERAAELLARREPVTLRALVKDTGVSTMAVYTYFGGMNGLWGAVRAEGFARLAARLADVRTGQDPVRHLAALGVAYVENAVANPALYRVMFDAAFELTDPELADATFAPVVDAVRAAQTAQRFSPITDPGDIATRFWVIGHGLASLTVSGVLPSLELRRHAAVMVTALFIASGDQPPRAERSVRAAWNTAR